MTIIVSSPIKDHDQIKHAVNQRTSLQKNKLKSKSETNIRKKHAYYQLKQQLQDLKLKINKSKDILTTIYSKVKTKEAIYENELSKSNLNIHRVNKKAQEYKKMYEDGLKLVESCVERNQRQNMRRGQKLLSNNKLLQLKKNAIQTIREKRKTQQQQIQIGQSHLQDDKSSINHPVIPQFNIDKTKTKIPQSHKDDKIPINKMKKSSSAINTRNKYTISDAISKIQQKKKQFPIETRQKAIHSQTHTKKFDKKKALYEIYKQRIEKRQKQQNSQKMSWIVDKLKQNIDDLQLIRKKSQIKLQKQQKFQSSVNQSKFQQKSKKTSKELEIKRQTSKQRYLQIQKNKLKSINQSLE